MTDQHQPALAVKSEKSTDDWLEECPALEIGDLDDMRLFIESIRAAERAPLEARIAELEQRLERRENAYQVLRAQRNARRDQREGAYVMRGER